MIDNLQQYWILLIGVGGGLVAIVKFWLDGLKIKEAKLKIKRLEEEQNERDSVIKIATTDEVEKYASNKNFKTLKSSLSNFIGGLAVIAIVSASGWVWNQYSESSVDTSVILSPSYGSSVTNMVQVSGTYSKTDANKDLWLVVQPTQAPQYHPQTLMIRKQTSQHWKSLVYIGSNQKHNTGEEFVIHLVAANDAASSVFLEYLQKAGEVRNWEGLDSLPVGSSILHSINVVRK